MKSMIEHCLRLLSIAEIALMHELCGTMLLAGIV